MSDIGEAFAALKRLAQCEKNERMKALLMNADGYAEEASAFGIELRITNNGHHWQFRKPPLFCEWYPSTRKFFAKRDYTRPIYFETWGEVLHEVEFLARSQDTPPAQQDALQTPISLNPEDCPFDVE